MIDGTKETSDDAAFVAESLSLFPNPTFNSDISSELIARNNKTIKASIYDTKGLLLTRESVNILRGLNHQTMAISDLPKGLYLLSLDDGLQSVSKLFFKN